MIVIAYFLDTGGILAYEDPTSQVEYFYTHMGIAFYPPNPTMLLLKAQQKDRQ